MQELTIEQKAKAYEGALERAKKLQENSNGMILKKWLWRVFPDLKESESEKIKKEMYIYLDWLDGRKDYAPKGDYTIRDMIAWVEKQGATIQFFSDEFEYALGRIIAFWNQKHKDGIYDENELMSYIKVRETELIKLFTDNVCKVSLSDCSEEYRKAYYDGYNKCNRDWLEKQSKTALEATHEEKVDNANKIEPKFKVGNAGSEYNVLEVKDFAGVTYYGIEDEPNHIDYVLPDNCEIVENHYYGVKEKGSPYPTKSAIFMDRKPANKVEPKFHEGDWITIKQ